MKEIVTRDILDAALESAAAGGVYLEDGVEKPFVFVVSDTDPGATTTYRGKTVDVWWVQTSPPDPSAWVPKAATFSTTGYTIPTDTGATYTVNGTTKTAGTYAVTPPLTVTIRAVAKSGYTLAGTVEWSKMFEEQRSAYEAVALSFSPTHFWAGDDVAAPPKDRGTAPYASVNGFSAGSNLGGASVGVGPSSWKSAGALTSPTNGEFVGCTAFTFAFVMRRQNDWAGWVGGWAQRDGFFKVNASSTSFTAQGPSATKSVANPGGLPAGRLMHYAVTWDGATVKAYVDGVLVDSFADTGATFTGNPGNYSTILWHVAGTAEVGGILIDKGKALTAAQIQQLSNAVVRS